MNANNKPRILLYLGKFPGYGFDIDGGSILARQLIDSLKHVSILDIVFIRKNKETFFDEAVNSIRYVEYIDGYDNKFNRRMKNLATNRKAIGDYTQYDKIITAHVSKFFGFRSFPDDFWDKTILFPMFCTTSYIKAGEYVPKEYTEEERFVIHKVNKIITPSYAELKDLASDYCCPVQKINVVYRGINPIFGYDNFQEHKLHSPINIVYIGSFKPQKNNLAAIQILNALNSAQPNEFRLSLIGTIQDRDVYQSVIDLIESERLTDLVTIYPGLPQEDLSSLLKTMDINLSVSNWETFGRGIYEGISSGLPTFVFEHLSAVKDICENNAGVRFCHNKNEMVSEILDICSDQTSYNLCRQALKEIAESVSYAKESHKLLTIILT